MYLFFLVDTTVQRFYIVLHCTIEELQRDEKILVNNVETSRDTQKTKIIK